MSQTFPPHNAQGRRRASRAADSPAVEVMGPFVRPPLSALLVVAVVVAVVAGAGFALGVAIAPRPYGPFAGCHTAAQLGPHRFSHEPAMCINPDRTYVANLNTTGGKVDIVMPAKGAPRTVNNFVVLAINGYFNGLTFHRAEGWVVQGGDPRGDGGGGPGYSLPDEGGSQAWGQGSVGMARFPGGAINGSQFFIVRGRWPEGGPGDVVFNQFGMVLAGIEVVNHLKAGDRILSVDLTLQG